MPSFHPNRWDNRRVATALRSHGLRCVLDDRVPLTGACHEKALVVDGETAFVGGIEPTDLLGDRFDAREHPDRAQIGWHDMTTRLRGPVVADVAGYFALRWRATTGEALETQAPPGSRATAGRAAVQLTRTVPERSYPGLEAGEFGVLESHLRALRAAQRFVYAESQYLWSTEIVGQLAALLRDPPHADFRVLLMLPAEPLAGIDDTHGQVAVLERADAGAGRFLACTPRGRWPGSEDERMVYVHAKVTMVDDRWMSVGSANLSDQSLFNNTELNVVTDDAALVTGTRRRLWAEHLDTTVEALADDPVRVVDERWRPLAERELDRYRAGDPPGHRLRRLPGAPGNGRRLLGPAQSVVLGA